MVTNECGAYMCILSYGVVSAFPLTKSSNRPLKAAAELSSYANFHTVILRVSFIKSCLVVGVFDKERVFCF